MLLTLKPSAQNRIKGPHEYAIVRQSIPTPRSSPPTVPDASATGATSPKPSRRVLPPPSSISLQLDVGRSNMAPMSQLPPAPPGWSSSEDLRQWLQAKAEEDRRLQEEEKTRQESLRLEQRKIEQSMLRDSLQSGVPPQMIPLIFAGITGGSLPQSAIELIQQYASQNPGTRSNAPPPPSHPSAPLHQQQPSALDLLPPPPSLSQRHTPLAIPVDIRRDSRGLPSTTYASLPPHQQPIPGPVLSQPLTTHGRSPTIQSLGRPPLSSGAGKATTSSLSRINGETHLQHVPLTLSNAQYATGSSLPSSQPAGVKQEHPPRHSPPSLYFHHWVPPGQPPPAKNQHDSTVISIAQPQRRYEYQSSPGRKRKSQIPHQPAPLPSSRPSDAPSSSLPSSRLGSPIASNQPPDSRAHHRQRSDASSSHDLRMQDHREANQGNDSLHQKAGVSSTNQRSGDLSPTKDSNRGDIPSDSAGVRYRASHMSDNVNNSNKVEDAAEASSQS
ncbi:uncharacterized protein NFIA_064840 [Aspergillus fischeri NRRL 181]|uniref:Uncharacterized protein n=1 Tax=Neosartorya fischeri (strain ATCC 1020 / DSM 3700 / CBS 544.65 / FGSC A1164 / JCM 1740 / NRRL 181 / WB 181) TaxID=331117 RepID=A1D6H6_NEOFI|nr:conserved hypothetical protein [Aspergillus fischeri NRRL 181]EAW21320.1 conserved hypothetical protein [Aspergillus fischeri NRRL 181]KAG2014789.1 hypothetical protein GB937_006247 [Aspergillus fischeri]